MHKLLCLVVIISSAAVADWTKLTAKDFELNDHPQDGTAIHKKELAELHRLQRERDQKDCYIAGNQLWPSVDAFFGTTLTTQEMKSVRPFIEKVFEVTGDISSDFKKEYQRPRPFLTDKKIEPCIKKPPGTSYPSTHAALAMVGGCVLADRFPEKSTELKRLGKYYGDLRAIVGVHYPSDVKAGQNLGLEICSQILSE